MAHPVARAEFLHVKPGKGAAFVRSKIKNLRTGNTVEKTFRAGEPLTAADVNKQQCQFTYTEVLLLRPATLPAAAADLYAVHQKKHTYDACLG